MFKPKLNTKLCVSTFPSVAMLGIPVRPFLFISGILSDSEGTSCVMHEKHFTDLLCLTHALAGGIDGKFPVSI